MNIIIEKDTERISELADIIIKNNDAELIELNMGMAKKNRHLSFVIDAVGGVSIGTCVRISKNIKSELLDENYANGNFKIEVSSPGIDRPLVEEGDFRRKVGRNITLWHENKIQQSPLKGVILSMEDGVLSMENFGKSFEIAIEDIVEGKLEISFKKDIEE